MRRVKLTQVMMTIPVESGDDYDVEIEESLFVLMQKAQAAIRRVSDACNLAQAAALDIDVDVPQDAMEIALQSAVQRQQKTGDVFTRGYANVAAERAAPNYPETLIREAGLRATANGVGPGQSDLAPFENYSRQYLAETKKPIPPGQHVSQIDPEINTKVSDSEMGREDDMTIEELRERPERTRNAPRPRANSWRHKA